MIVVVTVFHNVSLVQISAQMGIVPYIQIFYSSSICISACEHTFSCFREQQHSNVFSEEKSSVRIKL